MRPLISLLLLLLLPTQAIAKNRIELKPQTPGAVGLELEGEYRLQFSMLDEFALDAEDPASLLSLSPGQLRDRARQAYADLFGAPPPELVVEDASGTGERYPPGRGRT